MKTRRDSRERSEPEVGKKVTERNEGMDLPGLSEREAFAKVVTPATEQSEGAGVAGFEPEGDERPRCARPLRLPGFESRSGSFDGSRCSPSHCTGVAGFEPAIERLGTSRPIH